MDRWHTRNKKSTEKSKSKDNPKSSGSRRSGFSLPGIDTKSLEDAPIKFHCGKDFLPDRAIRDLPSYMQRMHNWYKSACRLGLQTVLAPHHPNVFELKAIISMISSLASYKTNATKTCSKGSKTTILRTKR